MDRAWYSSIKLFILEVPIKVLERNAAMSALQHAWSRLRLFFGQHKIPTPLHEFQLCRLAHRLQMLIHGKSFYWPFSYVPFEAPSFLLTLIVLGRRKNRMVNC